ncbi:hypothetical protein [Papillibacter cinnamivorans]|uniref:Uncharacterized protein n=1 Tax=Papillibacter cinnamivorans DSM 12816 TaxID=1122930 RepID=A0A1W2CHZ2_9FIRM|nr:hypothetical protein [Papillibacter cinnamivorans]SMC84492.1 hypothetical protein SAMN02745168_0017 [Papillibacter cinnamivorans DSM 12816]
MVLFIVFGAAMLAGILILNLMMDTERIRLYELLVRAVCGVGMVVGLNRDFSSALRAGGEPDYVLFLLLTGLLIFPQFLASDYIQYRKKPDDIKMAQHTVRMAVAWVATTLGMIAVTIWFHLAF